MSGAGGAENQSHAGADHGSVIAGHDGAGHNAVDDSTHVQTHDETHVDHSANVDLGQDHSSAESDQHLKPVHVDVDHSAAAGGDVDHHVLHA